MLNIQCNQINLSWFSDYSFWFLILFMLNMQCNQIKLSRFSHKKTDYSCVLSLSESCRIEEIQLYKTFKRLFSSYQLWVIHTRWSDAFNRSNQLLQLLWHIHRDSCTRETNRHVQTTKWLSIHTSLEVLIICGIIFVFLRILYILPRCYK